MATTKNCVTSYLEKDLFFALKEYSREQKLSQSKAIEKIVKLFFLNRQNSTITIDDVDNLSLDRAKIGRSIAEIDNELEPIYLTLLNKIEALERAFTSFSNAPLLPTQSDRIKDKNPTEVTQ